MSNAMGKYANLKHTTTVITEDIFLYPLKVFSCEELHYKINTTLMPVWQLWPTSKKDGNRVKANCFHSVKTSSTKANKYLIKLIRCGDVNYRGIVWGQASVYDLLCRKKFPDGDDELDHHQNATDRLPPFPKISPKSVYSFSGVLFTNK